MPHSIQEPPQRFGGDWTEEKLKILRDYLDFYTTALNNQRFTLHYVDAFAGTGGIEVNRDGEAKQFLDGSPLVELDIDNKPFDHLHLIEKNPSNTAILRERLSEQDAQRRAQVYERDANKFLREFCRRMGAYDRAVVFLDPFGLQVDWETVAAIARTRKCDTWILFPAGTVRRLIPGQGEVSPGNAQRLNRVYGGEGWKTIQRKALQSNMFSDDPEMESEAGVDGLVTAYVDQLRSAFSGVANHHRVLRNSRNAPLYVFMFAVSSQSGKDLALRGANHILNKL